MSLERRRQRSWLATSCVALTLWATATLAVAAEPAGLDDLAGPLRALALQSNPGATVSAAAMRGTGVTMRFGMVQVEVDFRSPAGAAATGLGRFGATTEVRRDSRVQALVPPDQLLALAALPQVAQVRPSEPMIPLQGFGTARSEGVQLTNATAMHLAGVRGSGARVAIIDAGFAGLSATEVPVNVATPGAVMSFPTSYGILASSHGTAVAEVVADMAPDCTMTLIAVDSTLSAESAIDYVITQGFNIVVMAMGTVEGPFDQSHPLSLAVNRARAAGIFWVNSAGNFAQRHWEGLWQDLNSDSYLEFTAGGKDFIVLDLPAGQFDASLSWFETAGWETAQDYDLVLTQNAANGLVVARSAITQNGDDVPREPLRAFIPAAGQYRLKIQRVGGIENPDKLQLYTPAVDLEATTRVADNSLAIPADADGAFAVGATRGSLLPATGTLAGIPVDDLEPFSSRGAAGQTTKPALVAPDSVTTSLTAGATAVDGLNPFIGTSCSAAHVAGAAALLFSEDASRKAGTIEAMLLKLANPVPTTVLPAVRNAWGGGRLALRVGSGTDSEAPVITFNFPTNNSTITISSPRVLATITDSGGVQANTIDATLDGTNLVVDGQLQPGTKATYYDFNPATGLVDIRLSDLTRTRHTLTLQVQDLAGNDSGVVSTNFRLTTRVLEAGIRIIGLPYPGLVSTEPGTIFGLTPDEIAGRLVRWVPSDSRYSKYHSYPDDYATFSPPDDLVAKPPVGLGYFLSLPRDSVLNVAASSLTDATYEIKLVYGTTAPKGWNLIGNPYEQYVDWGSVEFVSDNGRQDLREATDPDASPVTEGVLFHYVSSAGGGYYSFPQDATQDTMAPLEGFWLHVLKNATLVVHNPGGAELAAKPAAKPAASQSTVPAAGNWLLQLQARAGKYEDPINYIGVSGRATDGYDAGVDVAEPPPLVDALRMYMPKRDWGSNGGAYAKDVRSGVANRQEFDVEVACRLADVPVTVSWPTLGQSVARDVTLRLQDVDTGATVYMRTSSGYTFTMKEPGVRRLRIVATTGGAGALAVTGLAAMPTAAGVALSYTLSADAEVDVEIRNISGALIRRLPGGQAVAGTAQTALWNGVSEHGTRAPQGKYFARITARTTEGQTVQALRPFTLGR